jgi:hypothetical protein
VADDGLCCAYCIGDVKNGTVVDDDVDDSNGGFFACCCWDKLLLPLDDNTPVTFMWVPLARFVFSTQVILADILF